MTRTLTFCRLPSPRLARAHGLAFIHLFCSKVLLHDVTWRTKEGGSPQDVQVTVYSPTTQRLGMKAFKLTKHGASWSGQGNFVVVLPHAGQITSHVSPNITQSRNGREQEAFPASKQMKSMWPFLGKSIWPARLLLGQLSLFTPPLSLCIPKIFKGVLIIWTFVLFLFASKMNITGSECTS